MSHIKPIDLTSLLKGQLTITTIEQATTFFQNYITHFRPKSKLNVAFLKSRRHVQ